MTQDKLFNTDSQNIALTIWAEFYKNKKIIHLISIGRKCIFKVSGLRVKLTGETRRFVVTRVRFHRVRNGNTRPRPTAASTRPAKNVHGHTARVSGHTSSDTAEFQVGDWDISFRRSTGWTVFVIFLNVDSVLLDTGQFDVFVGNITDWTSTSIGVSFDVNTIVRFGDGTVFESDVRNGVRRSVFATLTNGQTQSVTTTAGQVLEDHVGSLVESDAVILVFNNAVFDSYASGTGDVKTISVVSSFL